MNKFDFTIINKSNFTHYSENNDGYYEKLDLNSKNTYVYKLNELIRKISYNE